MVRVSQGEYLARAVQECGRQVDPQDPPARTVALPSSLMRRPTRLMERSEMAAPRILIDDELIL